MQQYADVLPDNDKTRLTNCIHNLLTGEDLDAIPADIENMYSASDLGSMFGVSAYVIGTIANKANLKNEKYGAWVPNKTKYRDQKPSVFKYNEAGRKRIGKLIKDGK